MTGRVRAFSTPHDPKEKKNVGRYISSDPVYNWTACLLFLRRNYYKLTTAL